MILDPYTSTLVATLVLFVGSYLVKKVTFLQTYNIPHSVAGGLVTALFATLLYYTNGVSFASDASTQSLFMLLFFASVGLSADLASLRAGGRSLVLFVAVIAGFIVVQNSVGISLAALLGLDPLLGLVLGSITLTGGHGTAGAWGETLESVYGVQSAISVGMASATFGLVLGGLIGGPLARQLIKKHRLLTHASSDPLACELPSTSHTITPSSLLTTIALLLASLVFTQFISGATKGTSLEMPTFIWTLFGAALLRNTLAKGAKKLENEVDLIGTISLSLYIAMALLSLRLWELADLATPLAIILLAQVVAMALYAYFVTFRVMGRDYDASVLSAGHCGFGLGATPTAVANMQAITLLHAPSHKAFLIVPLCGAFFVDIINAVIIQTILKVIA